MTPNYCTLVTETYNNKLKRESYYIHLEQMVDALSGHMYKNLQLIHLTTQLLIWSRVWKKWWSLPKSWICKL